MTRLSINIKDGTLEVEGEESFVKEVYSDFKEQVALARLGITVTPPQNDDPKLIDQGDDKAKPKATKKPATKRARVSFSIVKDLDLSSKSNSQSLRDFYASKNPTSAMEKNTVFVYFLQQIAKVSPITLDHIYSCYTDVNSKYPNALRQSVADTAFHRGWLDTSSFADIKLATPGENYVEHDLPKPETK